MARAPRQRREPPHDEPPAYPPHGEAPATRASEKLPPLQVPKLPDIPGVTRATRRKGKPGRPPALTPARWRLFLQAVALHATVADACAFAGIGRSTMLRVLAAARQSKRPEFRALWDAVEAARARTRIVVQGRMVAHSAKYWGAAAWLLERTQPDRFGPIFPQEPPPPPAPEIIVRRRTAEEVRRGLADEPSTESEP